MAGNGGRPTDAHAAWLVRVWKRKGKDWRHCQWKETRPGGLYRRPCELGVNSALAPESGLGWLAEGRMVDGRGLEGRWGCLTQCCQELIGFEVLLEDDS